MSRHWCAPAVTHLLLHNILHCMYVVQQVMHSQRLSEAPLKAWVIIGSTVEVSSAHCTCMVGIAETCTHVWALLFKVEATVRCREMRTVTDKPAYWILSSNVNKVNCEVGHQIDYSSAAATPKSLNCLLKAETVSRPGLRTCASKLTTPPPIQSYHNSMQIFIKLICYSECAATLLWRVQGSCAACHKCSIPLLPTWYQVWRMWLLNFGTALPGK